jgi:hypothetical protein
MANDIVCFSHGVWRAVCATKKKKNNNKKKKNATAI